jgi:YD repeat-containing protein
VEFSYNPLKQLTEMRDWLGLTSFTPDALGRTEKITDFEGKSVRYEWDELNRKEKIIYPDGKEVKYAYNRSGKLSEVISTSGETRYQDDAMGRISQKSLPGDVTTEYEYNPSGRLSSMIHRSSSEILDRFKYAYDPVGNITQIDKYRHGMESDNGTFNYAYDPLGRLTAASNGADSKEYFYDSLGNRIASLSETGETQHEYNALNQLVRTQDGNDVEEFSYDRRGNLTEVLKNGTLKNSYVFDATNMMTEAISADKGRAKYTYDGFRNRVKRLEQLGAPSALMADELQKTDPCNEVRCILDMTLPYNNLLMTHIGGVAGLTLGAATGVMLAGSAVATTAEVVAGATTLCGTVASGGLAAGGTFIANNIQKAFTPISQAANVIADKFRSFTRSNFRWNLQQLTNDLGIGKEAHHVLPQKFIDFFTRAGLNIHNPIYGSWVDKISHSAWSYAYNEAWRLFFTTYSNPTVQQILAKAVELAREYGFTCNF